MREWVGWGTESVLAQAMGATTTARQSLADPKSLLPSMGFGVGREPNADVSMPVRRPDDVEASLQQQLKQTSAKSKLLGSGFLRSVKSGSKLSLNSDAKGRRSKGRDRAVSGGLLYVAIIMTSTITESGAMG